MLVYVICIAGFSAGCGYALQERLGLDLRILGVASAAMAGMLASFNFDYVQPMAKMSTICEHAGYVEARLDDDGAVSCIGVHDTELYNVVLAEYNEYMGEGND